jgi:glutamate/tyrosine decarboxylase-like PLP-dependent enzyme
MVTLPEHGCPRDEVRRRLRVAAAEDIRPVERMVAGAQYPAGDDVLDVAKEAYLEFFSTNALLPSLFPSLAQFERAVISMTAHLLHGQQAVGSITSGGTESILMGVKSARDRARLHHPQIRTPQMVVPVSAHPAFWKAAHYFGLEVVRVPLDDQFQVDMSAYRAAITPNTVLLVGSAPSLTLCMVDPIEDLGKLALERNIGLHVDACVGGFFLPFVEKLGVSLPVWDFRVAGVTTISADLHKYGYTAKGASVILSRDPEVFSHQIFRFGGPDRQEDWYVTPSMTGTRPGGAVAAAWAVMMFLGEDGYLRLVKQTLEYLRRWWAAIDAIPGLEVMGHPTMSVFAFTSRSLDIFAIADGLEERGWLLFRDSFPVKAIRFMQSPGHEAYVDKFMADLREVTELVRNGQLTSAGGAARYT